MLLALGSANQRNCVSTRVIQRLNNAVGQHFDTALLKGFFGKGRDVTVLCGGDAIFRFNQSHIRAEIIVEAGKFDTDCTGADH